MTERDSGAPWAPRSPETMSQSQNSFSVISSANPTVLYFLFYYLYSVLNFGEGGVYIGMREKISEVILQKSFCMTLTSCDFFLSRKALRKEKNWSQQRIVLNTSIPCEMGWGRQEEGRKPQTPNSGRTEHLKRFPQDYQLHTDAIHPFLGTPQDLEEKLGSWDTESIYYAEEVILKSSFMLLRKPEEKFLPHLLHLLSFPLCSNPSLIETDNIRVSEVTMTTSVPPDLQVRTYWLELWSSADKPAGEKHPDTKEPIGTRTTVSLYPF